MGLPDNASAPELRRQYQKLMTVLMSAEAEEQNASSNRYSVARNTLTEQYEKVRSHSHAAEMHSTATGGLLLGEILVESEVITRDQLDDALMAQCRTQPPLPLGRILVSRRLITWEQLAYFLKLQDLLELAPTAPSRMSRQLIELGLISRAELETAELDAETTGCSMGHILIRRGWVKASVISALTGSPERKSTPVTASSRHSTAEHRILTAALS